MKSIILTINILIISILSAFAQNDTAFIYRKPLFDFDINKPLLSLSGEQLSNNNRFLRFDAITGYREGVRSSSEGLIFLNLSFDMETLTRRLYMHNISVEDMITIGITRPCRVLWDVKDPSRYRYQAYYGDKTTWLRKNGYCFEYMFPDRTGSGLDVLAKHIAALFGLEVNWKICKVKSLVLVRTSAIDKIKTRGGDGGYSEGILKNQELRRMGEMIERKSALPFVDETNYTGNVDIDLHGVSWTDIPAMRKKLQQYDLDLIEKVTETKMLVITDIKN